MKKVSICRYAAVLTLVVLGWASFGYAQTPGTVKEVMDGVVTRIYATLDADARAKLDDAAVQAVITPEERRVLASKYWCFDVNVPVVVSVMRDASQAVTPFWLAESGFTKTDGVVRNEMSTYEVWQKEFGAGRVELGINGFDKHRPHYFVCIGSKSPGAKLEVSHFFPENQYVSVMRKGAFVYHDWDELVIDELPAALEGQVLLTTIRGRAREAHIIGAFRDTPFPASKEPDQVALTWSEDPQTTQSVQWRANTEVKDGAVRYRVKGDADAAFSETAAVCVPLEDRLLANDRYTHRFTGELRGLQAGTCYEYQVGSPVADTWSAVSEFCTAPAEDAPFSFLYLGDTHRSPEWGAMMTEAYTRYPETDFCMIGGDLVSTGLYRDEWDHFFEYSKQVFNRVPLMPCIGNHDDQDGLGAAMYLTMFDLPKNGPDKLTPERAYSFRYGNALFLILDVCGKIEDQTAWLEAQLAGSDAVWKFAMFHFPPYSPAEDYPGIRKEWGPLFDKYHVDFVFSGHVHHYQRSKPLRDGKVMASPAEGTIYLISISIPGDSLEGAVPGYVEKFIGETAMYQIFDIAGKRLHLRAFDATGQLRDELRIEK